MYRDTSRVVFHDEHILQAARKTSVRDDPIEIEVRRKGSRVPFELVEDLSVWQALSEHDTKLPRTETIAKIGLKIWQQLDLQVQRHLRRRLRLPAQPLSSIMKSSHWTLRETRSSITMHNSRERH